MDEVIAERVTGGVTFDGVSRRYSGAGENAVNELSLDIQDGEFMVFVGPSGCGKSTSLRMVAGLEPVDSGEIYIGATPATRLKPKDRDVAMVFQTYALYPYMSVADNLAYGLKVARVPRARSTSGQHPQRA